VINLDFKRKGKEARDVINNWVKQRTMEKITTILNDVPNPLTSVILLSALYFKGEWNQYFLEEQTRKYRRSFLLISIDYKVIFSSLYFIIYDCDIFYRKQFFIEPNDVINVDMMYTAGNFFFYEDRTLKIVALPYKGLEVGTQK